LDIASNAGSVRWLMKLHAKETVGRNSNAASASHTPRHPMQYILGKIGMERSSIVAHVALPTLDAAKGTIGKRPSYELG
jgi:hypothetical protein